VKRQYFNILKAAALKKMNLQLQRVQHKEIIKYKG